MMRLVLTREPNPGIIVGRARDGMGWCPFAGGAALRCGACGQRVRIGYMARHGGDYRCVDCVEFVDRVDLDKQRRQGAG